jgi:hypothetical protein
MINSDIIKKLDVFEKETKFNLGLKNTDTSKYKDFRKRLKKALLFFNKNMIYKDSDSFALCDILINGIESKCIWHEITPYPLYEIRFGFVPKKHNDDCGSGCGCIHDIYF